MTKPPPLRTDLAAVLDSAQQLVRWIAARQDGIEISAINATKVPGVLFDLCLEHHAGVVHLVTGRMNGSALALIRPQFEALVRGLWLCLCASDEEVRAFVESDKIPKSWQLIEAIERHDDFDCEVLSGIKREAWRAMHGYTHGGMHQITRRMDGNSIEPSYHAEEIIEALKASGTFALLALRQIGRLANDTKVIVDVTTRLHPEAQ